MKILALEFSSERRSVAVCVDGSVLGQAGETGGRTANSFALVEKSLAQAGLEREHIECIAVGLGPGSYAGIRSAIALAQGWQVARGIQLIGIGSVDCLAARATADGRVNFVIDAQRNEFYFAAYEMNPNSRRLIEPLCLLSLEETRRRCAQGTTVVPPELLPTFPAGHVLLPDAAALAGLAAQRQDFVSGDKLEPIYLRETAFVKAPPPRVLPSL